MSAFLGSVDRRAFKYALFAVRDEDTALDIVQDTMLKLTEKYAGRPADELPALFQRILQNQIRDYYRRTKVRSLWLTLVSAFNTKKDTVDGDTADIIDIDSEQECHESAETLLDRDRILAVVEEGLYRLPPRQREAFLLRYWEEMDVATTSAIMGCSEGSVKTHCSRATHTLAEWLRNRGIGND